MDLTFREAGMYRALEDLQGSILPRCFGYFRRFVNLQEMRITPWDPRAKFPRPESTFDAFKMPHTHASLNILLLEKLGKPPRTNCEPPPGLSWDWKATMEQCIEMLRIIARKRVQDAIEREFVRALYVEKAEDGVLKDDNMAPHGNTDSDTVQDGTGEEASPEVEAKDSTSSDDEGEEDSDGSENEDE
ncbi:hypothetical protein BN946_scf184493.g3 [Trametes cinnabarina]|uniref:Uncharacterized protein n=1 Tax=Pycnoporus cinnabarinus TaxID=5643 RepID=A0A060SMT2_PYCCI|nr:hypothetical protein BN946_scf184493.g3 [Trametes cinnabarina]